MSVVVIIACAGILLLMLIAEVSDNKKRIEEFEKPIREKHLNQ